MNTLKVCLRISDINHAQYSFLHQNQGASFGVFQNLAKGVVLWRKGPAARIFSSPSGLLRGECLAKKGISIQTGHLGPVDDIVEGCDIACTDIVVPAPKTSRQSDRTPLLNHPAPVAEVLHKK